MHRLWKVCAGHVGSMGEHGIYVAIYLTEINVAAVAAAGGDVPQ